MLTLILPGALKCKIQTLIDGSLTWPPICPEADTHLTSSHHTIPNGHSSDNPINNIQTLILPSYHQQSPVGSLILSPMHHQWTLICPSSSSRSSLSMPFLPAVDVRHVEVQAVDPVEGVVCSRTASNPTKIRTFPIRIGLTIGLVFSPALFIYGTLCCKRDSHRCPHLEHGSTMLSFPVLFQPLGTRIFVTTNWALKLLTMNTGSCVSGMHPFVSKNLPTLTTWEFLTPVDPHMDHKVVVGLKGLLAHQTVLSFPGYSWNLVGDLSNLPSLSTLGKVFPMKNGGHLLLYPF